MPTMFQTDIVIVAHAVVAMHREAISKEQLREVKTNEPGCAGNQNPARCAHLRTHQANATALRSGPLASAISAIAWR